MSELTYSDRELLLRTFDLLKGEWVGSDEELLEGACEWAQNLSPNFGFEYGLTRDIAALSRYLIDNGSEPDIADIARGGLQYILRANQQGSPRLRDLGLFDDAFISSYAVHEIQRRLNETATYSPPRLTRREQQHAENLFLELIEKPVLSDEALVAASLGFCRSLGNLAVSGIFRRLQKNIDFLASVLRSPEFGAEQRSYARAALGYLVCQDDAIDDRLGIIGYLDDNFIAQMAVDLIDPAREPWLALLDATVAAWPFLNGLIIDDGCCPHSLSEYMIINSALACRQLRGNGMEPTALIVPFSGPVPFLLGFTATLGFVQESGQRDVTEDSFRNGQKVLVDSCAVAEFAGYETSNGRRMFKLRQFYRNRGERLESVHFWPISDIRRLVPVDASRVPRGQLVHDLGRSDAPLPALEYLFNASKTADLAAVSRRTLVVMQAARAHELARTLSVHGCRLNDTVPMGQLTESGVKSWSTRFGEQDPLLVVVSDLDLACRFAEESDGPDFQVVVDLQGRNASKAASLRRLRHFDIPTLVVSTPWTAENLDIADEESCIWEWQNEDFESLLWPANPPENGTGPLLRHNRRLQSLTSSKCHIHTLPLELGDPSFQAVRRLRALARMRGDDHLAELDDIVSLSYGLLSRLLRCATLLSPAVASFLDVENGLHQLGTIRNSCRYLTGDEQAAAAEAEQLLCELFKTLQVENPKAVTVQSMLSNQRQLPLICPDMRLAPDLTAVYGTSGTRIFNGYNDDAGSLDGAIIPGWFRKDRMASLLMPPVCSPIHLVLYEIELEWYASFRRERRKARNARSAAGGRQQVFPHIRGWQKPDQPPSDADGTDPESSFRELEAIHDHVREAYRQRVYRSARSDGTEAELVARLIMFDGGAYAFLTESYKANTVTHLLDSAVDDDKADVQMKHVSKLKEGDAILFNRGSDRDVIRLAADEILPSGVRETSSLWRQALLDYAARESLTSEDVHQRLRDAGCPLQLQTVKIWLECDGIIAPQAYKRDVGIVAKVTGDPRLAAKLENVLAAISQVRSAHLRASRLLAKQVLTRAVKILADEEQPASVAELDDNTVVVRVAEIDKEPTTVRASLCNRLVEGETWRE